MIIHSYEKGKRAESCISYLEGSTVADAIGRVIILPIPTSRDNITILNTNVYINEVLEGVCSDDVVCGYGLSDDFVSKARDKGAHVLDLVGDERFLLDNAELTALCTVGIILSDGGYAPRDLNIGIVGYGRIGKRLTNLFLYLGARVRVFTSRENMRIDLCEYGVATAASSEDADLSGLDLLINTAPAVIFRHGSLPDDLRVIDLASGDNFPGARVEKYPSVPAKMLPYSAGRVWGRAIERFIVNRLYC